MLISMSGRTIRFSLAMFVALSWFAGSASAQRTYIIKTPRGNLEFTLTGARVDKMLGRSVIDGSVHNSTHVDINFLQFEFVYLDQNGNPLDVCNVLGNVDVICTLTMFDTIPSGGTVALKSPGNTFTPGKRVPKGKVISGFSARLIEANYLLHYSFDLKVKEMPQFDASFTIGAETGISFVLKNKLESPIEILWDQSSFINTRDESSRLVHAGVKYTDKERPQPNTVIPPMAKVSDTVYPSDYVVFSEDKWKNLPILPFTVGINNDPASFNFYVGKSVRLYLRLLIEDKKVDYLVSFTITEVH